MSKSQKDQKADRLAAALRENLKRRKAQARLPGSPADPVRPSTSERED